MKQQHNQKLRSGLALLLAFILCIPASFVAADGEANQTSVEVTVVSDTSFAEEAAEPASEPEAISPEAIEAEPLQPASEEVVAQASSSDIEEVAVEEVAATSEETVNTAAEPTAVEETPVTVEEPAAPAAPEATAPATPEAVAPAETKEPAAADDAAAPAEETTPAPKAEVAYPAVTLRAKTGDVNVTLSAPEGTLPEGTQLKVKRVGQKYIDAVADALEEEGRELTDAIAIDVTPVDKDGNEVQPRKTVSVTFAGIGLDVDDEDQIDVFRVSDDAKTVEEMVSGGSADRQVFLTDHFTIYVSTGSTTDPNGDGTNQPNSASHPLEIKYGDTVQVRDNTEASTWGVYTTGGDQYVTVVADGPTTTGGTGRTRALVTNINTTTTDQVVQIHHHRRDSGSRQDYWVKALAQRFTVSYKFQDVGQTGWADDGSEAVIKGGNASQQPAHADKTEGGVTYTFDGWYTDSSCSTKATLTNITADTEVYGKYKANKFTVTYDPKGGKIDGSTASKTVEADPGSSITIIDAATDKTGYTFKSWKLDSTEYDPGDSYTVNGNVTFEAQWTPTEYSISYDLDGGSQPDPANPTKYTVEDSISLAEPTKANYTFTGWTNDEITTPTKEISWSAGEETGNKSYKANWEAVEYSITYDLDGGTEPSPANPTGYTVEDNISITDPTKTGYTFDGWTNDEITTPEKAISWEAGEETGDKELKANWTAIEYGISYNLDGGSEPTPANPTKYTVEDNISLAEPTKDNYDFAGWTNDDITTPTKDISWEAGEETGDKEFKANWTPAGFSITYDLDGGTEPTPANPTSYTVEDNVSITDPTKTGYTFDGWTNDDITTPTKGISWEAGEETGDKEFTANWTAIEYGISYDLDGGSEPTPANPTKYTVEDNISLAEPTKDNYDFIGWTNDDITTPTKNISWEAGEETGDKSYKANWEATKYSITYDLDGGSEPSPANPAEYTVEDNVSITDPTKTGYTFDGWTNDEITTPEKAISWEAGEETGDKEFTANWTAIEYGISYDLDGGSEPTPANPTKYTVEDNISLAEPTKEGYTFEGWTNDDITTPTKDISWNAGEETGDKSYKANWEAIEYSITYDLDGGTEPSPANPTVYTVEDNVSITAPTKTGYTFEGWTNDVITTPTKDISWEDGEETGDKTFTANWEAVTYTITYNYAGGTEPSTANPTTYTVEAPVTIENEPTRTGYIFAGWTSYDTDPDILEPTTPVEWSAGDETGNKTFTANWKKKVTLTYELNTGDDQATLTPEQRVIELGAGDKINLATASFEGHEFDEWNTKQDGTGSHHAGGSEYTMPDHDVTLWAQWSEHPITVTYYYNYPGATESYKEVSAPEMDEYYQVINEKPTRDEYLFVGWSLTEGATELSQIDYQPGSYLPTEKEDIDLYAIWVMQENEAREYTQILEGAGKEVYYTGEEQKLDRRLVTPKVGDPFLIGISSVDNPKTSSGEDYKYSGYVRVGDKTDGDPNYHHLYAYVEITTETEVKGTNVGVYNGPMAAPISAHREGTDETGMEPLNTTDSAGNTGREYIEVTKNQLIIKAVPIAIETYSAKKAHDGTALTAGGTVTIGADDDTQVPKATYDLEYGENVITLRNGEKVVIEIEGTRTDVGSAKNDVVVHWSDERSTGGQHNYTVTKTLGTLTVYDFTAEFYPNTDDHVSGMPEDWEGDPGAGRTYELPTNVPTREHSTFLGWATSADGDPEYGPASMTSLEHTYTYPDGETDVKFYAKWDKEHDEVTYDPNGGVFRDKTTPTEEHYDYEDEITIAEAATRDYYTFVEWNTKQDGSGDSYDPDDDYTVQGNVTFYAQWEAIEYKITYDYAGGVEPSTANPDKYTVEDNVSISKIPTREGYTFEGWTGSGFDEPERTIDWSAGDKNGDMEFVANWKPVVYSITYDLDGGEDPETANPTSYTIEDDVTIENEPTRDGYEFLGWTGSGIDEPQKKISWKAGEQLRNKSYKANWKPIEYSITYDLAGGDEPSEANPTSYTVEDEVKIANEPTRDGYTFEGWTGGGIDEPQKTIEWSPGDDLGDKEFTANWKAIEYTITYDLDGGEEPATANPASYTVEDDVTIKNEPTREGYTFEGWTGSGIDEPVKTISWSAGDELGDKEYKANWKIIEYDLTFDPNGGSFEDSTDPTTKTYSLGEKISIPEAATWEGHTFKGWQDADGKVYQPGDEYTVTAATSFTALWDDVVLTITYDPNGGVFRNSADPTDESYTYNTEITIAEAPTREGYNFLYWKGSEYQPGDKYKVTEDHTFVAQWEKTPITPDPIDPVTPSDKGKKSPTTGDANTALPLVVMLAAAAGWLILLRRRRRAK